MRLLYEKEYYLGSIDEELKTSYRPVSLEVIGSAEKGISKPVIVSIDGVRKGFFKNTKNVDDSDDLELVVNCIGRRLGVKMAEEYRVFTKAYEKIGLLSVGVVQKNQDSFSDMRKVQAQVVELIKSGQIKKADWIEQWLQITAHPAFPEIEDNREYQCRSKEDCYAAICLALRIAKTLYPKQVGAYEVFLEEYLKMILFDLLIGQTDRTLDNYGLINRISDNQSRIACSLTQSYELAPLFDNATLLKPYLEWEQYSLNGMILERKLLCEVLFERFEEKVRSLTKPMLNIYEEQKEAFACLADRWIENESKEVLKKKLDQGYQILREKMR